MSELLKQLWAAQNRVERPQGGAADTVYMHGVITDEDKQEDYLKFFNEKRTISLASVLKQLAQVQKDPVRLHINSPGGSYFEGVAIRDALMADGRPMVSVGGGMVGSAATLPFLAAESRELSDGGLLFVHEPSTFLLAMGTADQIDKEAQSTVRSLRAMRNTVAQLYASSTHNKTSTARFLEYMEAETMFTPQEALDVGLIHRVISPEKKTPTAKEVDVDKATMAKALGLPEDVSDADLEAAFIAMKQRDDAAQLAQAQAKVETAFDAAMSVPLSQGKITPAVVEKLKEDYLAAENKEAFLSVQKATLAALAPNSAFNTHVKGSGEDPTGKAGDPEHSGDEPTDLVARVQARIDKHQKAGMTVTQAMIAARDENKDEFNLFRFTDTTTKEFFGSGTIKERA